MIKDVPDHALKSVSCHDEGGHRWRIEQRNGKIGRTLCRKNNLPPSSMMACESLFAGGTPLIW
jgi:hypothetical protein